MKLDFFSYWLTRGLLLCSPINSFSWQRVCVAQVQGRDTQSTRVDSIKMINHFVLFYYIDAYFWFQTRFFSKFASLLVLLLSCKQKIGLSATFIIYLNICLVKREFGTATTITYNKIWVYVFTQFISIIIIFY